MPKFVPRQRKHKVLDREKNSAKNVPTDTNQEQILPASKTEIEAKRQKLQDEIRAQHSSISSKKQKRLEKYIENKLKKDETLDLLRKLEKEKDKYDVQSLQRSSNLGKRNFNAYVNGTGSYQPEPSNNIKKPDLEDDLDSEDSFEAENQEALGDNEYEAETVKTVLATQGSGLAQPLEIGSDGLPVIQVRKNKRRKEQDHIPTPQELPWEGFSADEDDISELAGDDDENESSQSENSDSENSEDSEESDDDEESEYSSEEENRTKKIAPRNSAFKAWATQQLNQSIGHVPSYESTVPSLQPAIISQNQKDTKPKPPSVMELPKPRMESNRKAYSVQVERSEAIDTSRLELPILRREQEIMEAIHNNPVVVIKGDTGSGKTTQIPQFLFEAGYGSPDGPTPGMIGVTQPRRVAAVSMAKRVGDELGNHHDKVSYQIRFDSTVSSKTAVKFMTDGILLRELSQDLLLKKYSVIVIDEAHERSVNTDILIGMLSRIVPARLQKSKFNPNPTPLKLIIMSATLDIGDFFNNTLFAPDKKPPVVEAEGRQHKVTTHFALRSRADYVEEVVEKVKRAHRKLPKGGILVFLTGQNEIRLVANRLKQLLSSSVKNITSSNLPKVQIVASEAPMEEEDFEIGFVEKGDDHDDFDIDIRTQSEDEAEENEFEISDDEEEEVVSINNASKPISKDPYNSVHILPLYSQLPTKEQLRVFVPAPEGSRMIVLATNVAETSLTIPGIRYVFDTGRAKERKYDLVTGVQSFEIDYISKASAQQRAGRAGRTGPGHCWRLFTSAVFERFFPDHATPEILRAPAESIVLQLKGFSYPRPVSEFPFPTPPARDTLLKAERLLKNLGALTTVGNITDLGKELSIYPLSPRLGKILAQGLKESEIIAHIVSLVAGLGVSELFLSETQVGISRDARQDETMQEDDEDDEEHDKKKQEYGRARAMLSRQDKSSDALKLLSAVSMYTEAADKNQLCKDYFLRQKAMSEVSQLRNQLMSIVQANHASKLDFTKSAGSKIPSKHVKRINQIVASGYIDQIAIRADLSPNPPPLPNKPKRAIDMPYLPLIPLTDSPMASVVEKAIFIHPSSVLAKFTVKDLPLYVVYSHLQQSQVSTIGGEKIPKTRMFPLAAVDGAQLAELARDTSLIEYGKPMPKTKVEDIQGTPKRRECWVTTEIRGGPGFGWPLPPTKVRQVMDVNSSTGWRVEEVLS